MNPIVRLGQLSFGLPERSGSLKYRSLVTDTDCAARNRPLVLLLDQERIKLGDGIAAPSARVTHE
jgi:hypothetical protein